MGYSCELSSMCENMIIWVKNWLSFVICVKYPQCVKIWSFEWKFDFHWSFVWNILNLWKYGHLRENLIFIGYLCEISSMCEIWSWSENLTMPCVQFLMKIVESALCSAYDESVLPMMKAKGGHTLWWRVSHLKQKGDTCCAAHLSCPPPQNSNLASPHLLYILRADQLINPWCTINSKISNSLLLWHGPSSACRSVPMVHVPTPAGTRRPAKGGHIEEDFVSYLFLQGS
jgi:hypothetical protein